jgi:transcriptional regulator with XRE-family HTH domain
MRSMEILQRMLTEFPLDDVAEMLKTWRNLKGLTQCDAAKLLGVSVRTLQGWELGRPMPYPSLLQAALSGKLTNNNDALS